MAHEPGLLDALSDLQLVRRVIDRDELAFRALYRRHGGVLRGVITQLLGGSTDDVEDVTQEAWLAACRSMKTFRGDAKFSTWLVTIGVRIAKRRMQLNEAGLDSLDDVHIPIEPPLPVVIDLERSLWHLTDSQRAVLVLHDTQGFTHEEIGALLGMPPGTSRSLLTRGRRAMRRLLTSE